MSSFPSHSLIGADPREVVFTSGATESNNAAIKGIARFYKKNKKHLITVQTVSRAEKHVQGIVHLMKMCSVQKPRIDLVSGKIKTLSEVVAETFLKKSGKLCWFGAKFSQIYVTRKKSCIP